DPDNLTPRLRLGELLVTMGRPDEAEEPLRRVLEAESNPTARFNLGLTALARDDLKAAREQFRRCVHSPFTPKKASVQLAALCHRAGDEEQAAKLSQQASQLPGDFAWPDPYVMEYKQLAIGKQNRLSNIAALELRGMHREAATELQEMVAQFPDYRACVALG